MRKKIVVELRFIDIQAVSDFPHGANVERGIWISPIQLLAQVADIHPQQRHCLYHGRQRAASLSAAMNILERESTGQQFAVHLTSLLG